MSTYTTKEIFDEFFETTTDDCKRKVRPSVDRPELYVYEEKVGKQFYAFTTDEVYDMLQTFQSLSKSKNVPLRPRTFVILIGWYRRICDSFFGKHPDCVHINPYRGKDMTQEAITRRVIGWGKSLDIDKVNDVITIMYKEMFLTVALYNDCLINLFLCGISSSEEIASIKEDDVDFDNHVITINDRAVVITDRCAELLHKVHAMSEMEGGRRNFNMLPWRGSYLRFASKENAVFSLDSRTPREMAQYINIRFQNIRKVTEIDITPRKVFELGFYLHLVDKYGEERMRQMVEENESAEVLVDEAKAYGIASNWVSPIRQLLLEYIP